MRLGWAALFAVLGPLLLLAREDRYDGWYSFTTYLLAALVGGTTAYFGCTFRRGD